MKAVMMFAALLVSLSAQAQFRCMVDGRQVVQSEPCSGAENRGTYRCNVGGEVVYQPQPCGKRSTVEPLGKELMVPSDIGANYSVLEVIKVGTDDRLREIVTKRIGRNGQISYSRRLYDCRYNQVKYLGTGDSYKAMNEGKADRDMGPITLGSIAYYVGHEACK